MHTTARNDVIISGLYAACVHTGAPTGSGKTAVAEVAVLRMIAESQQAKAQDPWHTGHAAIYVALLKALARERLKDWGEKFGRR